MSNYYSVFNDNSFFGDTVNSNNVITGLLSGERITLTDPSNQFTVNTTTIDVQGLTERTITIPDSADADVVLTEEDQIINGEKSFMNTMNSSNITPLVNSTFSLGNAGAIYDSSYINKNYMNNIVPLSNLTIGKLDGSDFDLIFNKSGLTSNKLLKLDNDNKLISDSNDYLTKNNPTYTGTMTTSLSAGIAQINASNELISSNTLPDNSSANNFTVTNPHINFVTTNSVLMTNGTGYAYTSNTLPDISTGTILPVFTTNNLGSFASRWNYLYVKSGDFYSIDSGNILPSLGLTYDLGSSGKLWSNVYADTVNANTLVVNTGVASNLLPDADITRNLGSNSYRWNAFYTQNLTDNGSNITVYGANNGNKFQILDSSDVRCFNVNTSQGGRVWIGGSNQTAKFIIVDQDGNSVFDLRTGSNGRIAIGGLNTQSKFNIADQDGNSIFNINTGQNGRITVGGLGGTNKFNIMDGDGNTLFGCNSSSGSANISIQGSNYNYKFGVLDGTGARVFNVNTNAGNISAITTYPVATNTYDLGSNSLKWNNVYANNLYGNWSPSGSVIPTANNAYDLGSGSYKWGTIYTNNIDTLNITATGYINPKTNNTYSMGSPSLKWANIYASNFYGNWSPTGSLIPPSNNTYDLGSSSMKWANLYNTTTSSYNILASNALSLDRSTETAITASLNIYAGTSGGATTGNHAKVALAIKGGGGGNVFAGMDLGYYDGALPLLITSSGGDTVFACTISPYTDNVYSCGKSGKRWSYIWTGYGVLQTSDGNDKENICDCELGLKFVNDLKPKKYNWKDSKTKETNYGIVAQDLEETLIKHNKTDFSGLHKPEKEGDKYGINYSQLIPVLIKAVQELSQKVSELEELINK